MPSPRAVFEAVSLLAESKDGAAVVEGIETFASRVWSGTTNCTSRSADDISRKFAEGIPETLAFRGFPVAGKIGTALTGDAAIVVAKQMYAESAGWVNNGLVRFDPKVAGKSILPEVEYTAEAAGTGAVATWGSGRVRMGSLPFRAQFSEDAVGTGIHELVHHEQAFLITCRKADQLGIGAQQSLPSYAELGNTAFLDLPDTVVRTFLEFRAGRPLTMTASERARDLIASRNELFGRSEHGGALIARLQAIGNLQNSMKWQTPGRNSAVESTLERMFHPEEGLEFAKTLFHPAIVESEVSMLNRIVRPTGKIAGKFTDNQLVRGEEALFEALARSEASTAQLSQRWMTTYQNSLHEREARYLQYVGRNGLYDHTTALSKENLREVMERASAAMRADWPKLVPSS